MNSTFFRFILVGIMNTIVGLSMMYLLLHAAGFNYWWATFVGNGVGACVSFFLNRSFTFRHSGSILPGIIRFAAVILFCYFVSYSLGKNVVESLLDHQYFISSSLSTDLAVLVSTGLYTVLNYLLQKFIVFRERKVEIPNS